MPRTARIGAVVLCHNSAADLPACLDGLVAQRGIDTRIVVVDNASAPDQRVAMEAAFLARLPGGRVATSAEATPARVDETGALFVRHPRNDGYSAGNNIGARLAVGAGCEAVLIVNPDVRIADHRYLATLWNGMRANPDCLVAASRLTNLEGRDEHPLRETRFWEELLWFRQFAPRRFRPAPHVRPPAGPGPVEAEKVHGACLLIRSAFLEATGYLDEAVFLYCEEPILAARVRAAGGRLLVFPGIEAVHAHVAAAKGNPSRRMLRFIESRLYYFDTYSGYGRGKRIALHASYRLLALAHRVRAWFGPA